MYRLQTEIDDHGCATLRLNNPEQHNSFDDRFIAEMTASLQKLSESPQVRVVILCASGKSFSAGADLNWMRRAADYTQDENLQDALALAELLKTLNELSKPTIAIVQGAAFGGGVGLVAACDIAIASEQAYFCLSEVSLGLIPATISPYLLTAIGVRAARRYLLSGERFSAQEALRLGLVHQVVSSDQLETTALELCQQLLLNGPQALAETKQMIRDVANQPIDSVLCQLTAEWIAAVRASAEGREGVSAFLQKRKPNWIDDT
jgi:methylglutaconyl-CoA hydratase